MVNNFKYDFTIKRKKVVTAGFLLLLTVVLLFFINAYAQGQFHSLDSLRNYIKGFGIMAPAVLILLQAAQVVLPVLPGFFGCAVGALLFGSFGGFWYNYIGISIGSIIAFFLARQFGIGLVKALFTNKQYEIWSARLGDSKRFSILLFASILLPLFPDDFLCYFSGLTNISSKKFIWIIILAKPWCILAYSLIFAEIL
ncbi:TVP38/TMEM64 family protein [Lacrimispora sp. 38-1]|uniref:TVP38/TMEM64 family protein n=1 Tax=Lacrimispora sp. 38-1 TaxID=3125778 RepID=UPI003CEE5F73